MPPQEQPLGPDTLLRVRGNDQIREQERLRREAERLQANQGMQDKLAGLIQKRFHLADNARRTVSDDMLDALRRRKGEYGPARLAEIQRQGGSEIFMRITDTKATALEAWLSDVLLSDKEGPWALDPTPRPDLPPPLVEMVVQRAVDELLELEPPATPEDIDRFADRARSEIQRQLMDEAKARCERMKTHIDDQLQEGGFLDAMDEIVSDLATYGTGIMRGPFVTLALTHKWLEERDWAPRVTQAPLMRFRRVDPFHFFPSRGATDPHNARYVIERDEFDRLALHAQIGIPGWNEEKIRKVLKDHRDGVAFELDTDAERRTLEDRDDIQSNPDDLFQGLWHCGVVSGWALLEWGLRGLDETKGYEVVALTIADTTVHVRLNADPLGRRWYEKTVYRPVKGSFWGQGVPKLMEDVQDTCNATARHLINNIAIGSGPQIEVNIDRLAEGQSIRGLRPCRIWQASGGGIGGATGKAVEITSIPIKAQELMGVYNDFLAMADERTGIPAIQQGTAAQGAFNAPATSLSILLNQAGRILKKAIQRVDSRLIRPMIEKVYAWNMQFVDDPSIKGDAKVVASGALGLFVEEQQQLRINETLALTANEADRNLMGDKGRAELLRASMDDLPVDPDKVMPTDEEIEQRQAQEQAAMEQAQAAELAAQAGPVPAGVPVPAAAAAGPAVAA